MKKALFTELSLFHIACLKPQADSNSFYTNLNNNPMG